MASNLLAMASNLEAMASNQISHFYLFYSVPEKASSDLVSIMHQSNHAQFVSRTASHSHFPHPSSGFLLRFAYDGSFATADQRMNEIKQSWV